VAYPLQQFSRLIR